jgi:murein DD-endopeptidase MepM/ murein hydrolase activator NlpD
MSCVVELLRSRLWPRGVTLALITIGLAACSGDPSRLNGNLFGTRSNPEATGSFPPEQAAPVDGVDRQPLPPQNVQPPSPRQHAGPSPASRPAPVAVKRAPVAAMSPAGNAGVHVVAQGETLTKISRLYGKPISEIAKANNIQATSKLSAGDRLVIPGMRVSAAMPKATPAAAQVVQAKPAPVAEPKGPERAAIFAPVAEAVPSKDSAKVAEATGALPKFRWPAKGRVIAGFGPTTNGQQNNGINISLPENTPVKAAEDGVVDYAGNELNGYGNLVQVRHPNGYVTAYAHAKDLLVKRGDQVKRGQPIARSGQTGNVNAPQLHFEIRKGALPLDPIKFLNGA